MYYSQSCSYCSKVFYTFNENKEQAAHILYTGIKTHLKESDEDDKEYKYDDGETTDSNMIYSEMDESNEPPSGGYPL
ncbi:MAG TPA: hypothetical protein VM077_06055 [Candidatus Limnocylindrales bacterium]|nr:hypothetical protein [Candidatus Limnocylindrales bacterium]